MKRLMLLILVVVILCCSSALWAYTLTFDEYSAGTELQYSSYEADYGATFLEGFKVADHTDFSWGKPYSGSNVLVWDSSYNFARFLFGHYTLSTAKPYSVCSVGAYFSTQPGTMVKITAYRMNVSEPVTSVVIGTPGASWSNQYMEITSSNGVFEMLEFEGVNSSNELRGFCADNMTVTPVPEPSSLIALGLGVLPIAAGLRLRRRRA
ncbi:MAG: PEP-CTERM sorting domain-containing protein [Armatimonadota bacterium]